MTTDYIINRRDDGCHILERHQHWPDGTCTVSPIANFGDHAEDAGRFIRRIHTGITSEYTVGRYIRDYDPDRRFRLSPSGSPYVANRPRPCRAAKARQEGGQP